jgi:hypothetical protein
MSDNTRISISLPEDQAMRLKTEAARRDISHGVMASVLVRYGLENLEDPSLEELITQERDEYKKRRAAGGKAGMASRWHATKYRPQKE